LAKTATNTTKIKKQKTGGNPVLSKKAEFEI
jgi:hypothetical protein